MGLLQKLFGTTQSLFQLGLGGPNLQNNSGVVEARNNANSAYAIMRAAAPNGANDLVRQSDLLVYAEVVFIAGNQVTSSTLSPFATGARSFDTSQFPATIGSLSRNVKFIATLQNTVGVTKTTVALYDVRNAVVVTGTSMDNSGSVSQVLPYDVESSALTLGTLSGDLQTGSPGMYEVQIEMVGGGTTDIATCSHARLIVYYA